MPTGRRRARSSTACVEYGNAIKDLVAANIFPGDMLYKNFGVTRHGRVVFYDYDEIEYLTDCNFRDIPQPRNEEDEMSAEPWYPVGKHDVFPEEFGTFLLGNPKIREYFMQHHADLLDAATSGRRARSASWPATCEDVFPYPQHMPFSISSADRQPGMRQTRHRHPLNGELQHERSNRYRRRRPHADGRLPGRFFLAAGQRPRRGRDQAAVERAGVDRRRGRTRCYSATA